MNPSITAGSGTGGDGPAITIDLNPTVPKTVGDALLEPAVIGVAVVVAGHTYGPPAEYLAHLVSSCVSFFSFSYVK